MRIAASSDANALAIRDRLLPIVREHGAIEDFALKNSPLRLLVFEQDPWRIVHWTPFNALAPGEASSPGYRHALEHQHTRSDLPYGLEVWHDGGRVLSLLWADAGAFEIIEFRRGAWEAETQALRPPSRRKTACPLMRWPPCHCACEDWRVNARVLTLELGHQTVRSDARL